MNYEKDIINIKLAEFMGWTYYPNHSPSPIFTHEKYTERTLSHFKFTDSMDELTPVLEKIVLILGWEDDFIIECENTSASDKLWHCTWKIDKTGGYSESSNKPAEAVSKAALNVIEDINDRT